MAEGGDCPVKAGRWRSPSLNSPAAGLQVLRSGAEPQGQCPFIEHPLCVLGSGNSEAAMTDINERSSLVKRTATAERVSGVRREGLQRLPWEVTLKAEDRRMRTRRVPARVGQQGKEPWGHVEC